jgi:hypothetical protein
VTAHVHGESGVIPFFLEKCISAGHCGTVVLVPGLAGQNKEYTTLAVEEGSSIAGIVVNKRRVGKGEGAYKLFHGMSWNPS